MDVLWFRLSRKPADTAETMGRFDRGSILVMLNRGDYWQCAYVIPKGSADTAEGRRHREVPPAHREPDAVPRRPHPRAPRPSTTSSC